MWVCVSVGNGPSVSGKQCHSYINKPDRGDKHWVGRNSGDGGGRRDDGEGERWWRRKVMH